MESNMPDWEGNYLAKPRDTRQRNEGKPGGRISTKTLERRVLGPAQIATRLLTTLFTFSYTDKVLAQLWQTKFNHPR